MKRLDARYDWLMGSWGQRSYGLVDAGNGCNPSPAVVGAVAWVSEGGCSFFAKVLSCCYEWTFKTMWGNAYRLGLNKCWCLTLSASTNFRSKWKVASKRTWNLCHCISQTQFWIPWSIFTPRLRGVCLCMFDSNLTQTDSHEIFRKVQGGPEQIYKVLVTVGQSHKMWFHNDKRWGRVYCA